MSDQETRPKEQKFAPHLPAVAVHAEMKRPSSQAVFVTVKVMDSKGDDYYFDAACFAYDLRKEP